MVRILLPLPESMLKRVDEVRGNVPRVRWIRRAIERDLRLWCPYPSCDFTSDDPEEICPRHGWRVKPRF